MSVQNILTPSNYRLKEGSIVGIFKIKLHIVRAVREKWTHC